jgi:HD superfamily phosphohydrolase
MNVFYYLCSVFMKQKVINDPVHGFIAINNELIFKIIEHPYFQRLRRIKQLGLTDFVYPGAHHTRFHHAIGAYHLMRKAIFTLQSKGVEITKEEEQGAQIAILLHDMGHGPFSHTLEHTLIQEVAHESISLLYMEMLNDAFDGALSLAIQIFKNEYPKKFLHQLVSGQLDVDRLDYLTRDSFFTGVSEGTVNYHRLIDMMDVVDNDLVIEEKGIYSVEKFLISRRIMYWQVYLHKTVLCAEEMLVQIVKRAKYLCKKGQTLEASEAFLFFLENDISHSDFTKNSKAIEYFSALDDIDIVAAIKTWMHHEDFILAYLCKSLIYRNLFKIKLQDEVASNEKISSIRTQVGSALSLQDEDLNFLVVQQEITSYLYNPKHEKIKILLKNGKIQDFAKASDQWSSLAMHKPVTKYYICFPKLSELKS